MGLFKAKAKNDIFVGFSSSQDLKDNANKKPFIEFVIGGWKNKKSLLRTWINNKEHWHASVNPDMNKSAMVTDDGKFHEYWVSYNDNTVTVGTGKQPGQNITMKATIPPKTVKLIKEIKYFSLCSNNSPIEYKNIKITATNSKKTDISNTALKYNTLLTITSHKFNRNLWNHAGDRHGDKHTEILISSAADKNAVGPASFFYITSPHNKTGEIKYGDSIEIWSFDAGKGTQKLHDFTKKNPGQKLWVNSEKSLGWPSS